MVWRDYRGKVQTVNSIFNMVPHRKRDFNPLFFELIAFSKSINDDHQLIKKEKASPTIMPTTGIIKKDFTASNTDHKMNNLWVVHIKLHKTLQQRQVAVLYGSGAIKRSMTPIRHTGKNLLIATLIFVDWRSTLWVNSPSQSEKASQEVLFVCSFYENRISTVFLESVRPGLGQIKEYRRSTVHAWCLQLCQLWWPLSSLLKTPEMEKT